MSIIDSFRRRYRERSDAGFTLPELLVAMLITTIVLGGLTGIYMSTVRTSDITQTRLDETNQARNGVESSTRLLRTAVMPKQLQDLTDTDAAFLTADYDQVSFYADIQNPNNTVGPSQVKLYVQQNASGQWQLWQMVQPPDQPPSVTYNYTYTPCTPNTSGCKARLTLLATGVQFSASQPIFSYFDTNMNQLAVPISGAGLANIDSVQVALTVAQSSKMGPLAPTSYVELVALPNHAEIVREQAGS